MERHHGRRSIRSKAFILLALFGLLPIVILGLISNRISSNILESELNRTTNQTLEKTSVNIDSYLQRMSDLSDFLSTSSDITGYMNKGGVSDAGPGNAIDGTLKSVSQFFNFPLHIYIVDHKGNVYSNINMTGEEKQQILKSVKSNPVFEIPSNYMDTKYWLGMCENLLPGYDSDKIYYLARNIMYDGVVQGSLYVGTSDYILLRMLDNIKLSDQSMIFALDGNADGMVIDPETSERTQADEKVIGQLAVADTILPNERLSGVNYSTTTYETNFNWKIVMATPVKSIRDKLSGITNVTVAVIFISACCILILLFLINSSLIRPIIYLSRLMKVAGEGNLEIRSEIVNKNEIGILSEGFNKLVNNFKKMLEKTQADDAKKKELEFRVLQSQIKPHFLYNSLNSIRWIAEMNNESIVGDSIVSLVRMLEYNTRGSEKYVSVQEEIQYIKEYLDLQLLRYWNRFEAKLDISQEILSCRMLKLTLQPIIENCLVHGMGGSQKLLVTVKGEKREDQIVFTIIDNGVGIEETELRQLREKLEGSEESSAKKGIGVMNVNLRIKLEFGASYGLSIESVQRQGTTVRIVMPLIA